MTTLRSQPHTARNRLSHFNDFLPVINLDKQQEVDVQTFDNQPSGGPSTSSNPQRMRSPRTMSQISGFKRPLMHTNSFTSDRLPVYGVETPHEATLGVMLNDINTWGIDIFKIGTLSCNRPLTCVAYQIFQVSLDVDKKKQKENEQVTSVRWKKIDFRWEKSASESFALSSGQVSKCGLNYNSFLFFLSFFSENNFPFAYCRSKSLIASSSSWCYFSLGAENVKAS